MGLALSELRGELSFDRQHESGIFPFVAGSFELVDLDIIF